MCLQPISSGLERDTSGTPPQREITSISFHSEGPMTALVPLRPPETLASQADTDSQLLDLWLHGRGLATCRAYERDSARFLSFVAKPVLQIKLADVKAYADSLDGLAPATRARAPREVAVELRSPSGIRALQRGRPGQGPVGEGRAHGAHPSRARGPEDARTRDDREEPGAPAPALRRRPARERAVRSAST